MIAECVEKSYTWMQHLTYGSILVGGLLAVGAICSGIVWWWVNRG